MGRDRRDRGVPALVAVHARADAFEARRRTHLPCRCRKSFICDRAAAPLGEPHHQVVRRRARVVWRVVRSPRGRGPCARRRERRGEVDPDQGDDRGRARRLGNLVRGRPAGRGDESRHVARAWHRRHLPAAGALSAPDGRREHRVRARAGSGVAPHRLEPPPARGARPAEACGRRPRRRSAGRQPQHAGAAARRDCEGDRIVRESAHHGRADGVAERAGGGAALRGRRAAEVREGRHHLHLAPARRDSLDRRSRHRAARREHGRHPRARRPAAPDADQSDDRPRAVGDLSEAERGARRGRARAAPRHLQVCRHTRCVARGSQRRNRRARGACRVGPHRAGADRVRPDARRLGRSAGARPIRSRAIARRRHRRRHRLSSGRSETARGRPGNGRSTRT